MIFKSTLRIFLVLLALALVTAVAIVLLEKIRGGSRLERVRAAYIADGGSFDRASRLTTPVPDGENFASIPALNGITRKDSDGEEIRAELGKLVFRDSSQPWPLKHLRGKYARQPHVPRRPTDLAPIQKFFQDNGLLPDPPAPPPSAAALFGAYESAHGAMMAELRAVRNRTAAVFLPLVSEVNSPDAILMNETRPELQSAQEIAKALRLHSLLALRAGESETALADIETMQKIAGCAKNDGKSVLSYLVSLAIHAMILESAWEGLNSRSWTAPQLERLQNRLHSRSLKTDLADALHAEIVIMDELLENLPRDAFGSGPNLLLAPWIEHNRATLIELNHKGVIIPLRGSNGYGAAVIKSEAMLSDLVETAKYDPRTMIAKIAAPALSTVVRRTALIDTELTHAVAACALERHYLANQEYPDQLESLAPDFSGKVPTDPVNGESLRYSRTLDGRYQLHSVGIDGIDNQGGEGDITWNYAVP